MIAGRFSEIQKNNQINNRPIFQSENKKDEKTDMTTIERKKSFRKTVSSSVTDDCMKNSVGVTDPELLDKLDSLSRPITREVWQLKIFLWQEGTSKKCNYLFGNVKKIFYNYLPGKAL